MDTASFRFHDTLNYFLPRERKNTVIEREFDWRGSVKDMIESIGVPHPEIELITVNSALVDFDYIVQHGDQIEVYPHPANVEIEPKIVLRPPYPGRPAFILDQHLGRLAAFLRMIGFDTLYFNECPDDQLAQISHTQMRILLTRDIGLLKRSLVTYGYYVRETNREKQLAEIARRFHLSDSIAPFKHCLKCNGLLHRVAKEAVMNQLQPGTAQYYDEFYCCDSCGKIYWPGSHYEKMQGLIGQVMAGF
jgi:uncharacterized protein